VGAALSACAALISPASLADEGEAAHSPQAYAVLVDDDLPIYRTVVTGIGVEALGAVHEYTLGGDASLGPEVMRRALAKSPAAIIAVGPKAANAARARAGSVPVLYCMVPRLESYRLDGAKSVGVRLERSYRAQLSALKALLPKASRVAVLYNPARSEHTIRLARRAASDNGLELVAAEIKKPDEAPQALAQLAGKADVLWMISDPTVLNLQTVDAMLTFAAEQRLPFIALNARFVERGALLSFSVDYARLGRQVGRIANQLVFEGAAAERIGLVAPEGLDIAFNLATAERVGESSELAASVLSYAAEHQHALRVYR
jgi:putative tryptophan/tyrosine transport system substrate-binding protein